MKTSEKITQRIKEAGHKYWASDNVSEYMDEGDDQQLIEELIPHFEGVFDTLIIDRFNDPNSQGTARRLAKMYINELMWGRYNDIPNDTAFPKDIEECYTGMLVVSSEIRRMC